MGGKVWVALHGGVTGAVNPGPLVVGCSVSGLPASCWWKLALAALLWQRRGPWSWAWASLPAVSVWHWRHSLAWWCWQAAGAPMASVLRLFWFVLPDEVSAGLADG